ncbi:IS21-like element helper ATPase IstB [Cytophagaceae bacterium DM2B3-1]|uniref:IS21-like element helper ATPase IstB n=1 Tax=Xanthocytophaga flava TaxID=3048013 RepID=A0ABT7CZ68_9BACT|nr:IS21-like element helper ATPase IstB [Xanthocytophaga flavus]MDJ1498971.1 IS21-like element helper ATPase IstB [Xanthocytophaga flavus]
MNNQATLEKLSQLKLYGMLAAFKASLDSKLSQNMQADELLAHLVESEWIDREKRKTERYIRSAHFRYQACIEQIDYTTQRGLDKNQLLRLVDCSYIDKKENLLITGPTGAGKSYLASALGYQACRMGYKVRYFNTTKLFTYMTMSKADNSYLRELHKLASTDLLIVDDFGLAPIEAHQRLMLLEIIEDRHGKQATLIASQLPQAEWYGLFGDQTIADAILDRLVHNAHKIVLNGESMRKRQKTTSISE